MNVFVCKNSKIKWKYAYKIIEIYQNYIYTINTIFKQKKKKEEQKF